MHNTLSWFCQNFVNFNDVTNCDRASEKGPSGHIKLNHLFQLCCIITKDIAICIDILNILYRTQDFKVMICSLCQLGPFLLAQSQFF